MSDGNGHDDEYDTPVEAQAHPANVPMIRAVGGLVLQLSALNVNLAGAVHEMRVAREPIQETGLAAKLKAAFQTLKAIGASGEQAFEK